jgi:microsomal dipeptidase-like Zn-dependent dipeptidase
VRNLSDDQVRGIAGTGGVIGIGVYKYATCGKTVGDTVRAMRYVADLVGVEHVALGSDFDGAVATVFDTTGWPLLTEALIEAGFSEKEIAAILGGNVLRVLRDTLP